MKRLKWLLLGLTCTWALARSALAARVVHVIPDNPSSFASAGPDDPQYIVALLDQGSDQAAIPAAVLSRSTIMRDAMGQQFNCSIPGASSELGGALATQQQSAAKVAMTKSPFDLLDSLTGLCLYRQDGLWTYEVCHKKHVRQFRQVSLSRAPQGAFTVTLDGDMAATDDIVNAVIAGDVNKAIEELGRLLTGQQGGADQAKGKEDFSCGKYSGDDQQTEAVLEDASSSGHYIKYVSHTFSGGADCVLTGAPRTAEVRYTCARDAKENVVLSVKEFPSCNYVVVISTPFLCKHPAFVPAVQDMRLISCVPIDKPGSASALPPARGGKKHAAGQAAAGDSSGQQQQQQQLERQLEQQLNKGGLHGGGGGGGSNQQAHRAAAEAPEQAGGKAAQQGAGAAAPAGTRNEL